nr:hypothetical protein [uncultured Celeribacter sp.]
MTTKPLTARIEVFRSGTFTPMQGDPITYSASDLKAIADAYDPETAPAPIVVGHPNTDAPAYGWIESFDYDATEDRLFANAGQIEPAFADLVKSGRFKKVSMSFFAPSQGHNPVPGTWYPKHLGFLGAAAPAVSGLKNAHFAGEAGVTFAAAYGERGFEEAASLFRSLREFLLLNFEKKDVDDALPSYQIDWLDDMEIQKPHALGFSAGGLVPGKSVSPQPKEPEKEPAVTKPQLDPAFATREAELSDREKKLADREKSLSHTEHTAFAESLVEAGKLLPASKDKVVAILDAVPGDNAVSFSEGGDEIPLGQAIRDVLEAQPQVVTYGALNLEGGPGDDRPAQFAADGHAVDPASLATHQKAEAFRKQNPGTSYLDAVKAVS